MKLDEEIFEDTRLWKPPIQLTRSSAPLEPQDREWIESASPPNMSKSDTSKKLGKENIQGVGLCNLYNKKT